MITIITKSLKSGLLSLSVMWNLLKTQQDRKLYACILTCKNWFHIYQTVIKDDLR